MDGHRSADECFWKQAEPYLQKELRCLRAALDALSDEVDDLRVSLGQAQVKLAILVAGTTLIITSVANIAAAYMLARHFGVSG